MKDNNVPKWFSDFAVQNQKEHGELGQAIEKAKGDLRDHSNGQFKWMMGILITALIAVIGLMGTIAWQLPSIVGQG